MRHADRMINQANDRFVFQGISVYDTIKTVTVFVVNRRRAVQSTVEVFTYVHKTNEKLFVHQKTIKSRHFGV